MKNDFQSALLLPRMEIIVFVLFMATFIHINSTEFVYYQDYSIYNIVVWGIGVFLYFFCDFLFLLLLKTRDKDFTNRDIFTFSLIFTLFSALIMRSISMDHLIVFTGYYSLFYLGYKSPKYYIDLLFYYVLFQLPLIVLFNIKFLQSNQLGPFALSSEFSALIFFVLWLSGSFYYLKRTYSKIC
jgi:hypothetical protein